MWRPIAVLGGEPQTQPWTVSRRRGGRHDVLCRQRPRSSFIGQRHGKLSRQSRRRRRVVGGVAADRIRSALHLARRDRRSAGRRGVHRNRRSTSWKRCRCRTNVRELMTISSPSTMSSRRSTSASAIAPIPKRSGAAIRRRTGTSNERAGKFPVALVAPQARAVAAERRSGHAAERASRRDEKRPLPDRRRGRPRACRKPQEPVFDLTKLPSLESITAGTDIRDFLNRACRCR